MLKILVLSFLVVASTAIPQYSKVIQVPSYVPAPPAPEEAPQPFKFTYEIKDDDGNTITRQESGDESGAVVGSYSYLDANGIYRRVQYTANVDGFQSQIETNEPGTANANPANVVIKAEEPPVVKEVKVAPEPAQRYKIIKVPYGYA
ncbi:cuticle protein 10.9-like [Tachypleus tridentatus]|uniref:cuticle protein 10.9-like n=1 Tax=Tachypleus tridentatus TaxID=6853 RepID=UPI003FCEE7CA